MFKQKSSIDELADYLKKNLKKGYTQDSLRWALIDQGYSKIQIERAVIKVDKEMASTAPILRVKPEIEYKVIPPDSLEEPKKWWQFWR